MDIARGLTPTQEREVRRGVQARIDGDITMHQLTLAYMILHGLTVGAKLAHHVQLRTKWLEVG